MTADSGLAIPTRISMGNVYTSAYPERKALVDMASVSHVYNFGVYGSKIIDSYNKAAEAMWVAKGSGDAKALLTNAIKQAMK
jgi:multiple sugar transport system substrate-binding protein